MEYCNGANAKGHDPREPKLLEGDPLRVSSLIKSLDFCNPFTSFAICIDREVDDERSRQHITSFEAAILPGLTRGLEYESTWYKHREYPRDPLTKCQDLSRSPKTTLHGIFANVELSTGKRLQPYFDPVDRKRMESWQELTNLEFGYNSPKDPSRKRLVVLTANRMPRTVIATKQKITDAIVALIVAGKMRTRAELVEWLGRQHFKI